MGRRADSDHPGGEPGATPEVSPAGERVGIRRFLRLRRTPPTGVDDETAADTAVNGSNAPGTHPDAATGPTRLRLFWRRRRPWIIVGLALAVVVALAIPVFRVWMAWHRIERVEFDPGSAREALAVSPSTTLPNGPGIESLDIPGFIPPVPPSPPIAGDDHTALLIIGSDEGGQRADVIMLVLMEAGEDLTLVSLPRDLYLENPCWNRRERINAALHGCGDVGGPDLLAIVVEDFTGVPVDHFVLFDFDGFARVIDAAGGVEVCVDHYTYDTKTDPPLALLAGCNRLDGEMALSWVRSRYTRQVVNGVDRRVAGVNDLTRNERQRDIVLQMLARLSDFPNPNALVRMAEAVPEAFTLDSGLTLPRAAGLAWKLRGYPRDKVATPTVPVIFHATPEGAQVLLPAESFAETMGWPTD